MPAPVPPGYTRGPLVWLGAAAAGTDDGGVTARLYQWLWREAGGYGARLVLLTVEAAHTATVAALHEQFAAWECDRLQPIVVQDRRTARATTHVASVQQATGIILVGDDPAQWAATLGGTPLAQAIRRANARSKLVAGVGAVAAFLCQHMITPGHDPTTLRHAVSFGPGLGLVNRLVVDATTAAPIATDALQRRLYAAVAANPFLIGLGVVAGSAAILQPDNTLQAGGPNALALVDGQAVEAADLDMPLEATASAERYEQCVVGAQHYTLPLGHGFNLDDHTVRPAGEIDLPPTGQVTSVF